MSTNWRSRARKYLGVLAILLAIAIVAAAFAFQNARRLLSKDSGPVKGDMIVLLGGGGSERPEQAAALLRDQAGAGIIVTGRGDCETNRMILLAQGVAPDKIEMECQSRSTKENALFTLPMLRKRQAHRVILVTTWYHSRRTLACFRHYAPDIEFYSRPSSYGSDRAEWKSTGMTPYIWREFVKLPGYWVVYGVPPW